MTMNCFCGGTGGYFTLAGTKRAMFLVSPEAKTNRRQPFPQAPDTTRMYKLHLGQLGLSLGIDSNRQFKF
jgi:hypothetical protein